MGPFEDIAREKVVALHMLIRFLRRLNVIGKVHTTTLSRKKPVGAMVFAEESPSGGCYTVQYDRYNPDKEEMRSEMLLEKIFEHKMSTDSWMTHFKF